MQGYKIVVIGDGAVGKTCLLSVFAKGEFPTNYVPTIFDQQDISITHKEQSLKLAIWDTAGQEEFDSLRVLSYPNTDVFLLCFSLIDVTSLKNIKSSWIKELQQHCATAKYSIILVGTKSDLRDESNKNHVTKEMGEELKQEIGAFDYVECSAMTNTNVKQLFEKIMDHKLAEKAEPKKEGGCCSIC